MLRRFGVSEARFPRGDRDSLLPGHSSFVTLGLHRVLSRHIVELVCPRLRCAHPQDRAISEVQPDPPA